MVRREAAQRHGCLLHLLVVSDQDERYQRLNAGREDEEMQASWLLSLVEDIERHASACVVGCAPEAARVTMGGAVIGWADEWWKGRVIDAVEFDNRSDAIAHLCPDPWATQHTPCGYPSPTQPDTYVNEEWFGLFRVAQKCANNVDQSAGEVSRVLRAPAHVS